MRILFVTPYVPSLIRVRPYNLIKHLSRRHDITLVALMQGDPSEEDAVEEMRSYCEKVYLLPVSKWKALVSCGVNLFGRAPLQAAYTFTRSGRRFILQVAESGQFDLVHVEHIRGAHLVLGIKGIPRVFDSVDCITRLIKQRLRDERTLTGRLLNREELFKMRDYEPRIASLFDGIVMTTERDRRVLGHLIRRLEARKDSAERVHVVRNGVDHEYFKPMEGNLQKDTVVFSGKMGYYPNAAAVLRFYQEAFPLIRRENPRARFKIVGSNPPEAVRRLSSDPSVEVTGYVDDIRPHISSAGVVVCPMTVGVGIQNKMLEAMSMEKPVVASSVASRGIPDAVDGRHLMLADTPEEIAGCVLDIMRNYRHGVLIGKSSRRLVTENYSWESVIRVLEGIYNSVFYEYKHNSARAA